MAMIQITFTPSNSAQADLIGKLMAQYLSLDAAPTAETAQAVETAAAETPAPKSRKASKPVAAAATQEASAPAEPTPSPSPAAETTAPAEDPKPAAASSAPEAAAASPASSADSSSSAKQYTLEEVRAKLADISKAGKQQQVVALIAGLGAKKLTDVPADKYGQLMQEAEAL